MNEVERILRAQRLEKEYNFIYRLMENKCRKLEEYRSNCKHEIIVITESSYCYGGDEDNLYQKCLFCGEESSFRQHFYDSECIDVSQAKSMKFIYSRKYRFEIVKRLYIKVAIENPKLSRGQLQKIVETEIADPTKVFYEIANSVLSS